MDINKVAGLYLSASANGLHYVLLEGVGMHDKLLELAEATSQTPEQVLLNCALLKFTNYDEVARRWNVQYVQYGYCGLNNLVKGYCTSKLNAISASTYPAHA